MFKLKPYEERTPDRQYQDLLRYVVDNGKWKKNTNQGLPALTVFRPPIQLRYDLQNGFPLITERRISFWRKAVGEIFAFVNGATTTKELEAFGCDWWSTWATKENAENVGLEEGQLGNFASYGAAFHHFPTPNKPEGFNQFEALVLGLKQKPWSRTNLISPWVPYFASEFGKRRVFCAPCHGWINCHVHDGILDLAMDQRSADLIIGVPANLIQYSVLLLALAEVTGLIPGEYIHTFVDAHIYANQMEAVADILDREPLRLPTVKIVDPEKINSLFDFRTQHFEVSDYHPHPPISDIPVAV